MAKLPWSCLLLLLSAVPLSQTASTATSAGGLSRQAGSQGLTAEEAAAILSSDTTGAHKESTTVQTVNGEVSETSLTDNECHFYISVASTATTNNTVVDDMDEDTEVVLISSSPDVCYVRHVENATQTCLQNLAGNTNMSENATAMTDYVPGPNLTLSDLPLFLHNMCINKTITVLVPVDNANGPGDGETTTALTTASSTAVRKKRFAWSCCRWVQVYRRRCYWRLQCGGWWWGRCHWACSCYWSLEWRYICSWVYCFFWR